MKIILYFINQWWLNFGHWIISCNLLRCTSYSVDSTTRYGMACGAYDHESECWIYNGKTWTQTGQLSIDRYLGGLIEYKGRARYFFVHDFWFNSLLIPDLENSVLAVAGIYDNGASTEVFRPIFKIYREERNWLWFRKSVEVIMLILIIGKILIQMEHLVRNIIHSQLLTQGADQKSPMLRSIIEARANNSWDHLGWVLKKGSHLRSRRKRRRTKDWRFNIFIWNENWMGTNQFELGFSSNATFVFGKW